MTLHNLSQLSNKLRFAFNDETKQIHIVRVTPSDEEDLGAVEAPLLESILAAVQGVITTQTSTGPTVGATSTKVLAANAARVYASFVNDSTEDFYLAFGAAAVMHTGVFLKALGGSYEITHANLFFGAVNGICASGSKVLCVTEGV